MANNKSTLETPPTDLKIIWQNRYARLMIGKWLGEDHHIIEDLADGWTRFGIFDIADINLDRIPDDATAEELGEMLSEE